MTRHPDIIPTAGFSARRFVPRLARLFTPPLFWASHRDEAVETSAGCLCGAGLPMAYTKHKSANQGAPRARQRQPHPVPPAFSRVHLSRGSLPVIGGQLAGSHPPMVELAFLTPLSPAKKALRRHQAAQRELSKARAAHRSCRHLIDAVQITGAQLMSAEAHQ